jgi:hypothetical protein
MLTSLVVEAASHCADRHSLRAAPHRYWSILIYAYRSLLMGESALHGACHAADEIPEFSGMVTHRAPILAETALIFQSSFGSL